MELQVVPEGLAATAAAVEALTARFAIAHAADTTQFTAVAPPAIDLVSLQTVGYFSLQGIAHHAVAARGVEELGRGGAGMNEFGIKYARGDAAASSSYLLAGG